MLPKQCEYRLLIESRFVVLNFINLGFFVSYFIKPTLLGDFVSKDGYVSSFVVWVLICLFGGLLCSDSIEMLGSDSPSSPWLYSSISYVIYFREFFLVWIAVKFLEGILVVNPVVYSGVFSLIMILLVSEISSSSVITTFVFMIAFLIGISGENWGVLSFILNVI